MAKDRRTGSPNFARSAFAFFWIALGGLSAIYLFTTLTNPSALGGQVARTNAQPGETSISSEQAASALGAADASKIESTLRDLSQQIAEINTRLEPLEKAARPAGSLSENTGPSSSTPEPVKAPGPTPAQPNKPSVALAQPAEPPAEAAKPAEATKPAEAPKPTQVAALEPNAVEKPTEVKPAAPAVTSTPAPEDPAEAENEPEPTPPPVTVSEVPDEPVSELTPGPNLSSNLSSTASGSEGTKPAATEIAALSPTILPPAANDGTTRYGIEIGIVAKQDGLRPLWREFLTNHAALVAGLQPRRVLAPDKKWRLIAGPFANAAEANQACLLFKKAQQPCEATVFAGDSL
jgi:hypothetical protein